MRTGTTARSIAVTGAVLLAVTACGGGSSSSGDTGGSSGDPFTGTTMTRRRRADEPSFRPTDHLARATAGARRPPAVPATAPTCQRGAFTGVHAGGSIRVSAAQLGAVGVACNQALPRSHRRMSDRAKRGAFDQRAFELGGNATRLQA